MTRHTWRTSPNPPAALVVGGIVLSVLTVLCLNVLAGVGVDKALSGKPDDWIPTPLPRVYYLETVTTMAHKVVEVEVTRVVVVTSTRIIETQTGPAIVKRVSENVERTRVPRGVVWRSWWEKPENGWKVLMVSACVVSVLLLVLWCTIGHGFETMERWSEKRDVSRQLDMTHLRVELAQAELDMDKAVQDLFDQQRGLESIESSVTTKLPRSATAAEARQARPRTRRTNTP